jgi:hypothetical protein
VLSHPFHASVSHLASSPAAPHDPGLGAGKELAQFYNQLAVEGVRSGAPSAMRHLHSLPKSWEDFDIGRRSDELARQTNNALDHWMTKWSAELSRPSCLRVSTLLILSTDFWLTGFRRKRHLAAKAAPTQLPIRQTSHCFLLDPKTSDLGGQKASRGGRGRRASSDCFLLSSGPIPLGKRFSAIAISDSLTLPE